MRASESSIRLGLVGCGFVAMRGYLPALAHVQNVDLVAVADPDAGRRRASVGVVGYHGLEQMLSAERLDAVLVCSPPELHLAHAQACARAQIPALVEKPPGLTRDQALELASLHPAPLVGFNRRFAIGLPVGRQAVQRPTRMVASFDAPPRGWNPGRVPPPPLIDLGCHLVDLSLWITDAQPVRARAMPCGPGRARFAIELSGGLRLDAECGAAPAYQERLEVRNAHGDAATWQWPEPTIRQLTSRLVGRRPGLGGAWQAQLEAFVRVVRGGGPGRLATALEGVPVMAALDAVRISAAEGGRWAMIPPAANTESGDQVRSA